MPRFSVGTSLAIVTLLVSTYSVYKSALGELFNWYQLTATLLASIVSGLLGWTTSNEILYQYRRATAASGLTIIHLTSVVIISTLHQKSTSSDGDSSPMDPIVFILGWDLICLTISALCIYGVLWVINIPLDGTVEPTAGKTSEQSDAP